MGPPSFDKSLRSAISSPVLTKEEFLCEWVRTLRTERVASGDKNRFPRNKTPFVRYQKHDRSQ